MFLFTKSEYGHVLIYSDVTYSARASTADTPRAQYWQEMKYIFRSCETFYFVRSYEREIMTQTGYTISSAADTVSGGQRVCLRHFSLQLCLTGELAFLRWVLQFIINRLIKCIKQSKNKSLELCKDAKTLFNIIVFTSRWELPWQPRTHQLLERRGLVWHFLCFSSVNVIPKTSSTTATDWLSNIC